MEVEDIQSQGHKFRRIGNGEGRIEPVKTLGDEQYADEEEDEESRKKINGHSGGGGGAGRLDFSSGGARLGGGWPSSRIVRVSRASGGKDRHSKVLTSKGLRDRRVRLSVNTAIQFYDLQDRLRYDQPSKAVEWLLKAAASSIDELPPIDAPFPDNAKQLISDEKSLDDSAHLEMEPDPTCLRQQEQQHQHHHYQQQQGALPKSACSSNSETSKGSGLSLSRSESRIKARERARERAKAAEKDKDKDHESSTNLVFHHDQQNASSFTELLTSGINGGANNDDNNTSRNGSVGEDNFFQKSPRHYSTPMDYFASGLLGPSSTRTTGQLHLGNPLQQALTTVSSSPLFSFAGDHHHHHHHHQELQQFSFVQDHFIPIVTTATGNNNNNNNNNTNNNNNNHNHNHNEYNLNFSISPFSSSGLAGFSRGTLQSNSSSTPSLLPQFASIDGGGSQPTFFIGTAAPPQTNAAVENHHHHHHQLIPGFDARLQLYYGDGSRHSDQKGKGKG